MIEKPMLAATLENLNDLVYPIYCTPKLDGVRCCVVNGVAVTRNFKPFPNLHVRAEVSKCPEGFDGEIIVEGKKFNEITHLVMAQGGRPDFRYLVFDWVDDVPEGYLKRMAKLDATAVPAFVRKLTPIRIDNEKQLLEYEKKCLAEGYEGVMIRSGNSPYKAGRSTVREGYLLKLKRFTDSEAVVTGLFEQMENTNEKIDNALGHGERSSAKAGMKPSGTLGGMNVRDLKSGIEFSIGTGLDNAMRAEIWKNQKKYIGKIVKYKSQKSGEKDAPRFPVFLGWRHPADMSE